MAEVTSLTKVRVRRIGATPRDAVTCPLSFVDSLLVNEPDWLDVRDSLREHGAAVVTLGDERIRFEIAVVPEPHVAVAFIPQSGHHAMDSFEDGRAINRTAAAAFLRGVCRRVPGLALITVDGDIVAYDSVTYEVPDRDLHTTVEWVNRIFGGSQGRTSTPAA